MSVLFQKEDLTLSWEKSLISFKSDQRNIGDAGSRKIIIPTGSEVDKFLTNTAVRNELFDAICFPDVIGSGEVE
jgi:hypothetical protein